MLKLRKMRNANGRRIHRCYMCGYYGVWNKNWSWYGKIDDSANAPKFCSEACKNKYRQKYAIRIYHISKTTAKRAGLRARELLKGE